MRKWLLMRKSMNMRAAARLLCTRYKYQQCDCFFFLIEPEQTRKGWIYHLHRHETQVHQHFLKMWQQLIGSSLDKPDRLNRRETSERPVEEEEHSAAGNKDEASNGRVQRGNLIKKNRSLEQCLHKCQHMKGYQLNTLNSAAKLIRLFSAICPC